MFTKKARCLGKNLITIPLGKPSCCSSLLSDSPSTLYLAAEHKIKDKTATLAFTSPVSATTKIPDNYYENVEHSGGFRS